MIHYASLQNSPRLQRLLKFLSDGRPHTTREIFAGAEVCAVSTAVDELRENRFEIECRQVRKGVYEYQLMKGHQAPGHQAPEHQAPEHQAPEHQAPEHQAPEMSDEDKSKAIIESIMERNFQLSLKV